MRETDEEALDSPLKPIIRIATDDDLVHMKENEEFERRERLTSATARSGNTSWK